MSDYADAGYRLQPYKITYYADSEGHLPLKTERRAFVGYDCARKWAADVMYRNPKYNSVMIEME